MSSPADIVLSGTNLTMVFQGADPNIKHNLEPAYLTPTAQCEKDMIEWVRIDGTRQLAQQVLYGSKSKSALPAGATKKTGTAIHTYENFPIPFDLIMDLLSTNEVTQKMAVKRLGRMLANHAARPQNLRIAAVHAALLFGAVYFAGGHFQATSAGADVTLDYGIPAGNKGQLDILGTGAIINASWATSSTDIAGQLERIKEAEQRKYGYDSTTIRYGKKIKGYLQANDVLKSLITENATWSNGFLQPGIPNGFLGWTWLPLTGTYYDDKDGNLVEYVTDDKLVITPPIEDSWYQFVEGSYAVPQAITLGSDVQAMLANLQKVYGRFAYASGSFDPPSITLYVGDTFAPIIVNPNAVLIGDVTP